MTEYDPSSNTSGKPEKLRVKFHNVTQVEKVAFWTGGSALFSVKFAEVMSQIPDSKQSQQDTAAELQSQDPQAQPLGSYPDSSPNELPALLDLGGAFVIGAIAAAGLANIARRFYHRAFRRPVEVETYAAQGIEEFEALLAQPPENRQV